MTANMSERPNYYAIITADIRYSKKLSFFEKILYADITALTNKHGYCTASNGYFADLFDKSKETISRAISKLDKLGFLTVYIKRDKQGKILFRRLYISVVNIDEKDLSIDENINTPIDENINTPIDIFVDTPIDENVKGNNTSNIIIQDINNMSQQKKEAISIAKYLHQKISTIIPKNKYDPMKWVDDIEKAIRIDKRNSQDLIRCIDWIYSPSGIFWQKNILSGKKLREKYDQLEMNFIHTQPTNIIDTIYDQIGKGY